MQSLSLLGTKLTNISLNENELIAICKQYMTNLNLFGPCLVVVGLYGAY